jgi:hypothetical protein
MFCASADRGSGAGVNAGACLQLDTPELRQNLVRFGVVGSTMLLNKNNVENLD